MLVTESLNKRREQIFRLVGMGRRGWCRTYRYSLRAHLKQKNQIVSFENCLILMWAKMDSNHRRRKPADLQSAPFGHSGICPYSLF